MFLKYLARRLLYVIPMLFITTLIVFSFILLIPGDPVLALLGENATPEKIAQVRRDLGLDQPIITQYFDWLKNALQGDLGRSIFTGQYVHDAVFGRLAVTFQLVFVAMIISVVGGMFFAITSIYFPNSWMDYVARFFGTMGSAIPNFWLAMLLVLFFSLKLGWVPATGFTSINDNPIDFFKGILLPAISLGAVGTAQITRHLRSSLMEVMSADYVRTAYSKGVKRWRAIFNHGLQNAMLPVVTTIGILFGNLLGATVVIETVFAIPGMGQLAVNSILQRDFTMLQGVVLVMIVMVIIINFITDIMYAILDPRIEY
ncbi:peptide/nickel transport system permease protein [Mesobacillus persicus]|uniref:Peptide/nickel transport system permease protein n=1 Tax=Mesobacillus persicus TaxID=930146 RepID=A0A1H8D8U2_9BACI|nr:ABC transporter permease [Mesobacillus persicus]SEN03575.1 peptide/nickel transport system permease protein [Mesobacillus persicus]